MKNIKRWLIMLGFSLLGVIGLAGCGFPGLAGSGNNTIRIAAQNTTEQQIMSYMLQDMIEHDTKLHTTIISNLGSANVSFNAMKNNQADITAIRYVGSDLTTIMNRNVDRNPERATRTVKNYFKNHYHMTYFKSYGFADTYVWMVTQKTAKKYNLNNVSDLKPVAGKMNVGIDQIWLNRKGDGYDGFQKMYGYKFGAVHPMQIGLVYDAVAADKMDAILGYSTDGRVNSYHLKMLKDDKHFFPPYTASAVATNKVLKQHPELKPVINKLSGKIDLKTMQKLNYEVDNDLMEPEVVAKQYLEQHHYFEGSGD